MGGGLTVLVHRSAEKGATPTRFNEAVRSLESHLFPMDLAVWIGWLGYAHKLTSGAVLANIQPNPCSTTSSTHAETVFTTHPRHTATKSGLPRVQRQLKEKSG
ncbi:hypothetical protein J4Q44_G00177300 [Coregonus suidteri]|uniref:Uncharacterized protein n=1 Tax=Coregonus suidteri TaxID=861788 RepID=A0AAN8QUS5_9TELE